MAKELSQKKKWLETGLKRTLHHSKSSIEINTIYKAENDL